MSKQSNQKYHRELEKKSQSTSNNESTNSTKQENLYVSDKIKASSNCSNNTNTNH